MFVTMPKINSITAKLSLFHSSYFFSFLVFLDEYHLFLFSVAFFLLNIAQALNNNNMNRFVSLAMHTT